MNEVEKAIDLEAESRLRSDRTKKALGQASSLAAHLRRLVLETDGRTERGAEMPEAKTPLLTMKADDVDELYVRLLEWVGYWSRFLEFMPTSTAVVAWSRWNEDQGQEQVIGFRAGTTAVGAGMLVSAQTMWLLIRHDQIALHPVAREYQDDVLQLVWGLRARYGLTPTRERLVAPRPCPECGEHAIRATWASEDVLDVEIGCEVCDFKPKAPRASQIERWLS